MDIEDKKQHIRIIRHACMMLNLPFHVCVSSITLADILFESGVKRKSSLPVIYAACIFLASKVQETHQRLRDIINSVFYIVNQLSEEEIEYDLSEQTPDESNPLYKYMKIFTLQEYTERKDQVFQVEQHILRVINFDFSIFDAKNYLETITKINIEIPADAEFAQLKQLCFGFANDFFMTFPRCSLPSRSIAAGCTYCSIQAILSNLDSSNPDVNVIKFKERLAEFPLKFRAKEEDIVQACQTILNITQEKL
ncbi:unnamed protein product [Moneuplotes crassus]|uniref:Cyclin N-terminal domain-containing protein n=1 Tax=Euplotes crassus TaxID=5936 RepID=A0AAD1XU37_EUPCR|nr:unnamed protein product [Moneuplotes crassus]